MTTACSIWIGRRSRLRFDFAHAPVELERANRVLALWRGHRDLLVALDMTVPGQAVVRLRSAALRTAARAPARDGPRRTQSRAGGDGEPMKNMLSGVDVGTSKVCALIAEQAADGALAVIGQGVAPCSGLRKGVVVNIEATVDAIRAACAEAERSAGVRIGAAVVGVAGAHIRGLNSHGIVAVRGGEVGERDVERVIDAARAVAIPLDRQVLHILPQQYAVDDQEGVRDPRRDGGRAAGGADSYRHRGAKLRAESDEVLRARVDHALRNWCSSRWLRPTPRSSPRSVKSASP